MMLTLGPSHPTCLKTVLQKNDHRGQLIFAHMLIFFEAGTEKRSSKLL